GTFELGNGNNGVGVRSEGGFPAALANIIGGSAPGARNVISGNRGSGVYLYNDGASGNFVQGNYIGVDMSGTFAISNTADGISMFASLTNTIGGTNSGEGNLISANGQAGIFLNGMGNGGNRIMGNLIGTDVTGRLPLGNQFAGVTL